MAFEQETIDTDSGPIPWVCEKSEDPSGRHNMVREVAETKRPGWKKDRMLCSWCGKVMYKWANFKPNPQAD